MPPCPPSLRLALSLTPSEREPFQALSHQSICWNSGSHTAGQDIWEGVRQREKDVRRAPRTRAFSRLIHLHFLCSAWAELWAGGKSDTV